MYIASQVFATLSLVCNVLSRFFKKQHHNLLVNIFASFLSVISFFLLTAYMGMVGLIVSTIRSITFYFFAKNNWEKKVWLLTVFTIAQLATCTITAVISINNDAMLTLVIVDFILVFLKGTIYTYGSWQHNVRVFWWSSIISSSIASVYNLMHKGYMNTASEVLSIIILIYMITMDIISRKKEQNNLALATASEGSSETDEENTITNGEETTEEPTEDVAEMVENETLTEETVSE